MKSLSYSAGDRVRELKHDLILQVYLGRGLFWEGLDRARNIIRNDKNPALKQGVKVEVGLPPSQLSPPYPEDAPKRLQSWRSAIRVA
jgi:hypothetical protein